MTGRLEHWSDTDTYKKLPTVANLVLEDVEQRALTSCTSQPLFWKGYVDDTFTALAQEQIQQFHDHLNSIEPTIQFTIEAEVEGILPFLDTRITHHADGSLTTSVFRKKTHIDRYLDFEFHHPLVHKVAVARTLLTQVDRICMSVPDRDDEKRHITQALNSNGYLTGLVKRNWQTQPAHSPASKPVTPKATVVIPYVQHVSKSIRQILTPLEIQTCFWPHRTLQWTLVNLKDHIPLQQQAGVVYRVPCGTCPKVYVDQTSRVGTWPSLQLLSMQLMSPMSSIGRRPRWWTPTHTTTRDAHLSRGTSGQR